MTIPVRIPNSNESNQLSSLNYGQRVDIPSLNNTSGILRYVGQVNNKAGIWAGIELDTQGKGKNDGNVQGKQYFTCPPNTGLFIAVDKIIIHPPLSSSPIPLTKKTSSKASKSSKIITPRPSSIIKPKSSKILSPTPKSNTQKPSFTPKAVTPRNSFTPKPATRNSIAPKPATIPRNSFTPKPATTPRNSFTPRPATTPRNSFTPKTTTKLSSTPKSIKRHSLNSLTHQSRRSHILRTIDPVPPLQIDSSSDTTTASSDSNDLQQATHQLYDMLEKTQRERDHLQHQINTKEAAWERLVSSKESLSLQVQENEIQKQRLLRDLEGARVQVEHLQVSLAERDASIATKERCQEQQTVDQRRLERLDQLTRELQAQLATAKEERLQEQRAHSGMLEQVRRQLAESEETSATLEKESDELRRAGLEAIHAYEISVVQMKQQHDLQMQQKSQHIQQLEHAVLDFRQTRLFDDDEQFVDRQRHRLEEQLDLAMTELDHERNAMQTMRVEMEQLRSEVTIQRQQNLKLTKTLEALQTDFEKEVQDKKRLIEEADAAFELQAKAEDELYQLKLSQKAHYTQLLKQLEHEHRLMISDPDGTLREKMEQLHQENHKLSQELEKERARNGYLQNELDTIIKQNYEHMYCENCDKYNAHLTEYCPNQNETF